MDMNGKFDHIEDVLVNIHSGQWFGWSDSKNKVYENLIIHDESKDKPTKKFLEDELKKHQDTHDAKKYQRDRQSEYPAIGDQLDMLFHAIDAGKVDKTSDFYKSLKAVKDKYPKG
tara:strand:+ start:44 stop:388 length:345 start_codon:yes stop_codon:yes gene_type:complete